MPPYLARIDVYKVLDSQLYLKSFSFLSIHISESVSWTISLLRCSVKTVYEKRNLHAVAGFFEGYYKYEYN
jgi:hypothetical protein